MLKLATLECAGLVWGVLDPALSTSDSGAHLGALMDNLESLAGLRTPVVRAPRSYDVEANWKLLVDGSFGVHHFKVAHRKTIAHIFVDNMQIVDEFDLSGVSISSRRSSRKNHSWSAASTPDGTAT